MNMKVLFKFVVTFVHYIYIYIYIYIYLRSTILIDFNIVFFLDISR